MKTEDLIKAISADAELNQPSLRLSVVAALVAGLAVSIAFFQMELGVRENAWESLGTLRFPFKFVLTLSLAIPALAAAYRLARPEAKLGNLGWLMLTAPVLMFGAIALELSAIPVAEWWDKLTGQTAWSCVTSIPAMAVAPLIAMVAVLRYGAVTRPRLASLAAGLATAGLSATLYASHCPNDSPLFIATWYSIATAIVVLFSLLVAPRLLRW